MRKAIGRLLRAVGLHRSFEGAAGGRRWEGLGAPASHNASIFAGRATLARRAAHFGRNNPYTAAGSRALVSNIIGGGIRPRSAAPDPGLRKRIDELWARGCPALDADGRTDFYGLQSLMARSMIEAGEGLLRLRPRQIEDGLPVPLQLQALDPEQLDSALHRNLPGGGQIRAGVEFDALGRRAAYHLNRQRPGDVLPNSFEVVRVPAAFIIHMFHPIAAGQVRGVSALASVLLRLHELDQFEDATSVGQKVRAMFAGFIRDTSGEAADFAAANSAELLESGLEPGTLRVLPPGTDITFSDPSHAGNSHESYVSVALHAIAAGLGVTFEQLTGDMRQVNFSSARVALLEFRRHVMATQGQVVIPQLCQPVWERFIATAVLSGALDAPGFAENPAPFLAATWHPQGWDQVDPLKSAQADKLMVDEGFKSRSEVIAARGLDPATVDTEIAADQNRAEGMGISFGADAPSPPPRDTKDTEDDGSADEKEDELP